MFCTVGYIQWNSSQKLAAQVFAHFPQTDPELLWGLGGFCTQCATGWEHWQQQREWGKKSPFSLYIDTSLQWKSVYPVHTPYHSTFFCCTFCLSPDLGCLGKGRERATLLTPSVSSSSGSNPVFICLKLLLGILWYHASEIILLLSSSQCVFNGNFCFAFLRAMK